MTDIKFEYGFHPLAEIFPWIEGKHFDALVADIKANGLHEPITVKDKSILDGRNRYLACKKAGYAFKDSDFRELAAGVDPLVFVISKNIQRRHLTAAKRREIITLLISKNPQASSRQIASIAHASHHTVEHVRKQMSGGTGQTAQLRTGADGKVRAVGAGKPTPERMEARQAANAEAEAAELAKTNESIATEWFKALVHDELLIVWQRVRGDEDLREFVVAAAKALTPPPSAQQPVASAGLR
jgi:hypothetical protein